MPKNLTTASIKKKEPYQIHSNVEVRFTLMERIRILFGKRFIARVVVDLQKESKVLNSYTQAYIEPFFKTKKAQEVATLAKSVEKA